jgi:LysR family transcriptional regulator, regulator for bpeEF and oprC
MDKLLALQAFARVVELGGFTKAAESLHLSKTSVSDLVQNLETHLGARLLQRTTRRVTVTLEGAAFYERCTRILGDLEEAESSVMQSRVAPKGKLRVDAPGALAKRVILPELPEFLAHYPDLQLELRLGLRVINLVEEGVDCVLRVGQPSDSSLVARRIGTVEFMCCASPEYLLERGIPSAPEDLSAHQCVNFLFNSTGQVADWQFFQDGRKTQLRFDAALALNDQDACVAAALLGVGVVKIASYAAAPHLQSRQLRQILPEWTGELFPVFVMYPQSRHVSAKVRVFIDWVSGLFEKNPLLQSTGRSSPAQLPSRVRDPG